MKRIILFLAILASFQANAQTNFYELKFFKEKYNYLSGATSVNNNIAWDDDEYNITMPFKFIVFHDSSNNLHINGQVTSESGAVFGIGNLNALMNGDPINVLVGSSIDLIDRDTTFSQSLSPISYKVDGSAPNRILKLEYRNAGIYPAMNLGEFADSVNMQFWFHEKSNIFEVRNGPSYFVSDPEDIYSGNTGDIIAIMDSLRIDLQTFDPDVKRIYAFSGPSDAPYADSLGNSTFDDFEAALIGVPRDSFVYQFKPILPYVVPFGVEELKKDYRVFKSGSILNITLQSTPLELSIVGMDGKLIQKYPLVVGSQKIDLSSLANGTYLCVFSHKNARDTYKIILE